MSKSRNIKKKQRRAKPQQSPEAKTASRESRKHRRGLRWLAAGVCSVAIVVGFLLWKSVPSKALDGDRELATTSANEDGDRDAASVRSVPDTNAELSATDRDGEQQPRTAAKDQGSSQGTVSMGSDIPMRDINVAPPANLRRMARRQESRSKSTKQLAAARTPRGRPRLSFTENPIWAPNENATLATFWWDDVPDLIKSSSLSSGRSVSNIRPEDYIGAEACKSCHAKNHESWSKHPHRWMNAKANPDTVMGDFTGSESATIRYRGGTAKFFEADGQYRMRLQRDDITRVYGVNRTIGSRFQQYYVGKLLDGPEPENHPIRKIDFVLPFGYWLEKTEWVPVVHVDLELPDDERHDPFAQPANRPYDRSCASCHTTQAAGDRMLRAVGRERLAAYSPHQVSYDGLGYLKRSRPEVVEWGEFYGRDLTDKVRKSLSVMDDLPAEKYAAALGITCEACHNGARFHAEREEQLPRFFPSGDHVFVSGSGADAVWGKNASNANWSCAQCHTGGRSMFACGASTWNSTEYSDAMRGACYDRELAQDQDMNHLTCVHCHNPHEPTGKQWKHSADVDDQRCLQCHEQFADAASRLAHTHHSAGTSGDRCMNCHMPRINEGMQDVVRSHLIFSPTDTSMLEQNHPNACNLCHLNEKIDWTLAYLAEWYGLAEQGTAPADTKPWKIYSDEKLAANYPQRGGAVGIGWLKSDHQATRLVAVEAMAKTDARWGLPEMLQLLDDAYLLNRQFAAQRIEEMMDIDLRKLGYHHYMYAEERHEPLQLIRSQLLEP